MSVTGLNTTHIKGSYDLLTTDDGQTPEFLINGVPIGDGAAYTIVEVTGDYSMKPEDDLIYVDGTATITLIDPALAKIRVIIRNISGTTTIAAVSGTTEITTLTTGQATTMAPRPGTTQWLEIN